MSQADQQVRVTEEDAVLPTSHGRLHGREDGQAAATLPKTCRSLRQCPIQTTTSGPLVIRGIHDLLVDPAWYLES